MGKFFTCAFSQTEADILRTFKDFGKGNYEVWEIELDRYGNRYVIICRETIRGRNPKITLKRRIK